jgi:hypothetical protein
MKMMLDANTNAHGQNAGRRKPRVLSPISVNRRLPVDRGCVTILGTPAEQIAVPASPARQHSTRADRGMALVQ